VGDSRVLARFPSTTAVSVEPGRQVEFAVQRHDLRIFDPESGLRVSRPSQ